MVAKDNSEQTDKISPKNQFRVAQQEEHMSHRADPVTSIPCPARHGREITENPVGHASWCLHIGEHEWVKPTCLEILYNKVTFPFPRISLCCTMIKKPPLFSYVQKFPRHAGV